MVAGKKELPPNYRRGGSSRGGGRQPDRNNSQRGPSWTSAKRRKGRPAWTRSPDDTPLRCTLTLTLSVTRCCTTAPAAQACAGLCISMPLG